MAEALFRSISEVELPPNQDRLDSREEQNHNHVPQLEPPRAKRAQVPVACESCRKRKMKCDGNRPCVKCRQRGITCQFETQDGETHYQATKRKFEAMSQAHDMYAELFHILGTTSDQQAADIFRSIRSGYRVPAILKFLETGDVNAVMPDPRRLALEAFLISLAHSTGSLRDIAKLAFLTLDSSRVEDLPRLDDFQALRNRIVRVPDVGMLLKQSESSKMKQPGLILDQAARSLDASGRSEQGMSSDAVARVERVSRDQDPPLQVPAAPWTALTASDEAVSHFVSLFFAWINPTWRFVEQDLFLLGMRSRRLDSDLCSPLLVNSICAIASLQSEHEVAFIPGDSERKRITRGQHFHNEALRLWLLEENRPTITNVQALCILTLESNYRAKDRFGLTLIPIAARLNRELSLRSDEKRCAAQGMSTADFARLRLSAHWAVKCQHVITSIAFMSPSNMGLDPPSLPRIRDTFEDEIQSWTGYPLTDTIVAHRPTLYLRERCRLASLFQEIYDLILPSKSEHKMGIRDFCGAVDELVVKLQQWYQRIPFELHYQWPMSVAVWELHASYLAFHMTLLLATRTRLQQGLAVQDIQSATCNSDDYDVGFRTELAKQKLSHAISLAHRAAEILCDFRERYGYKVSPAFLLQLQAVTAGVLVQDPTLSNPVMAASLDESDGPIRDSRIAFDEVFRGLLGTGVEVMVARGIARMMYHSALQNKIALSQSTRSMLQIMSHTAWRPSDLSMVNSIFPNFASDKGYEDRDRMTELLSKWEAVEI